MANFPTYEFDGDNIIAKNENAVIAKGTEFAKVAQVADEFFDSLRQEQVRQANKRATHVITPNGMRATILGRTASLWDDEITVRFENGQIRHYATSHGEGAELQYVTEGPTKLDRVAALREQMDAPVQPDKKGLLERLNKLEEIRYVATKHIANSKSDAERRDLDTIVLEARQEKREVAEALDYLTSLDAAYAPPRRQYAAIEQADLGHSDSWLEVTASEMVAEAAQRDYEQIMQEGPIMLVAALDDGALADAATVREIAWNDVMSKTAAYQGEAVEAYRMNYVAATEVARRKEAALRQHTLVKAASIQEAALEDGLDEGLFL